MKTLSLSLSLSACASFSVLWKVLLSVGPRLTPTETVNYRRWQRSFHLATITHIPQPPSKDLQSPTQVQGGCSMGDQLRRGQMTVLQAHYTDIPLSEHSVSSVFTINTSIFFIVRSIKCQMPKSQPIDSLFTKPHLSLLLLLRCSCTAHMHVTTITWEIYHRISWSFLEQWVFDFRQRETKTGLILLTEMTAVTGRFYQL